MTVGLWRQREVTDRHYLILSEGKGWFWSKSLGFGTGEFKMQIIYKERYMINYKRQRI